MKMRTGIGLVALSLFPVMPVKCQESPLAPSPVVAELNQDELQRWGLQAAKAGRFKEARDYLVKAVRPDEVWNEENEAPWASPDAACQLGILLKDGRGGPPDAIGAARCFVLALRGGSSGPLDAYLNLASMYRAGAGVPRDTDFANQIEDKLRFDASQSPLSWIGNPSDALRLAEMFAKGSLLPRNLLKAADFCYVANDKVASRKLQEQAAQEGSSMAHWNLANSYRGTGWPVTGLDSNKAVEHLTKAGELGMLQAWFELGVLYHAGYGVPKDEAKAFEWFQKSPYFSANYLGLAYWEGRVTKRDPQKARHHLLDASNHGRISADGLTALATIYRRGLGVPKDLVLAARFSPLIVDEPAKPPAKPKARKAWAGDRNTVVDIKDLLQQDSPASSWLEYGKALMKVTRISSAEIALARASELGSAEAEMMLGQLYNGDWGISPGDDIHVVEPLKLDPAKGKALIDSASKKGARPALSGDSGVVQAITEAQQGATKYEGQDPRRLYFLLQVWNSKEGC